MTQDQRNLRSGVELPYRQDSGTSDVQRTESGRTDVDRSDTSITVTEARSSVTSTAQDSGVTVALNARSGIALDPTSVSAQTVLTEVVD